MAPLQSQQLRQLGITRAEMWIRAESSLLPPEGISRTPGSNSPIPEAIRGISHTPGRTCVIPGSTSLIPGMISLIPGMISSGPGRIVLIPGSSNPTPGSTSLTPGSTRFNPGGTSLIPGSTRLIPGRISLIPEAALGTRAKLVHVMETPLMQMQWSEEVMTTGLAVAHQTEVTPDPVMPKSACTQIQAQHSVTDQPVTASMRTETLTCMHRRTE